MKEYFEIIDNKYLIKYKLGEGGFSTVYLVLDMNNNCEYAAKILLEDTIFDKEKKINEKIKKLKNTNITKLVYSNEKGIKQNKVGLIKPIKYFIFEYQKKKRFITICSFRSKMWRKKMY